MLLSREPLNRATGVLTNAVIVSVCAAGYGCIVYQ
jgi:hypothetical protein